MAAFYQAFLFLLRRDVGDHLGSVRRGAGDSVARGFRATGGRRAAGGNRLVLGRGDRPGNGGHGQAQHPRGTFPFLWAGWKWQSGRSWRESVRPGVVMGIGLALVVLPLTVRNIAVGGDWVLTTSNGGINFFIGHTRNCGRNLPRRREHGSRSGGVVHADGGGGGRTSSPAERGVELLVAARAPLHRRRSLGRTSAARTKVLADLERVRDSQPLRPELLYPGTPRSSDGLR